MKKIFLLILSLAVLSVSAQPQMTYNTDYLKNQPLERESLFSKSIIPLFMFGIGCVSYDHFRRESIGFEGSLNWNKSLSDVSDIVQYSPGAILGLTYLTMSINGSREWNDIKRIMFTGATAVAFEAVVVNGLKYSIQRSRPNNRAANSFPSGHATTSFMLATLLHKEFGESVSPWFSVAGYGIATGVCAARVISQRHWMSDVIAGAGLGIFFGEFAYWLNDCLFENKGMASEPYYWPEDQKWDFEVYSHYNFDRTIEYNNCDVNVPLTLDYTLGAQAERRFTDWLGVSLSGDITQIRWSGKGNITLPDQGQLPLLKSFHAGLTGDFPIAGVMSSFADLQAGVMCGADYAFHDGDGMTVTASFPTSFDAKMRAGFSIRTSRSSLIKCYAGMEHYGNYGLTFSIGSSVNLTF